MKFARFAVCRWMAVVLLLSACGPKGGGERKITVATAANMQFAMEELARQFTRQTGIACELVLGSSGKLTAQIKEGAPYDVFVAANMKYPDEVHNSGLAAGQPRVYALGRLVLWSMVDGIRPSIDSLAGPAIRHIALANPKTAPYGEAAVEVLKHYGLLDGLQEKLVYGEDISQTNQFITSKSAEVGFTAMSVVLSPQMKGKGQWTVLDETLYPPIEQGAVVVKRPDADTGNAQRFFDFLFSAEGKRTLSDFGYLVNE